MSQELDLNALQIVDDEPYEAAQEIPQQFGIFYAPPQPGNGYSFFIPGPLVWLPEQGLEKEKPVSRPRVYFMNVKDKPATAQANPLQIVGSPKDEYNGQPFPCSIQTLRRARTKEKILVSDAFYLMRAIDPAFPEVDPEGKLNPIKYLVQALHARAPGAVFDGSIDWSARCNPDRDIFSVKKEEVIVGRKGCGMKYALKRRKDNNPKAAFGWVEAIPKDGLKYLDRFPCFNSKCDAQVRVFPGLMNFQPGSIEASEE